MLYSNVRGREVKLVRKPILLPKNLLVQSSVSGKLHPYVNAFFLLKKLLGFFK